MDRVATEGLASCHEKGVAMNAEISGNLVASVKSRSSAAHWLAGLVALLALLLPAQARAAVDILDQSLLKNTCASKIGSLHVDTILSPTYSDVIVHPRYPGGADEQTCENYSWIQLKGQISSFIASWKGRTTTSAWDCSHSVMMWGVYKKGSGSSWSFVGGGGSYGKMPGGDGGQCVYDGTGVPAGWGSFAVSGSSTTAEYRIGFKLWSHDDPALSHGDYCADPVN